MQVNRRHGFASPFAADHAQAYRRRLERRLPSPRAHPAGLDLAAVRKLTHALLTQEQPGRRSKPSDRDIVARAQRRRSLRNVALVHTAYDLLSRPRELTQLRWEQIAENAETGDREVNRWRENIQGEHHPFPLRPETTQALDAWHAVAGPSPFVFHRVLERDRDHDPVHASEENMEFDVLERHRWPPMSEREVGVILRKAAHLAGITTLQLSGRSGLIGAVRDMVKMGFTPLEAGDLAGWKDGRMHTRYVTVAVARGEGRKFGSSAKPSED